MNGPRGTGKTRVQNTVMARLHSKQQIALAVASSGIASTLLKGGRTAHSRFKIPLDATASATCGIKKGSNLAKLIQRSQLIFWDEAPMQNKHNMEAIDQCMQDLCDSTESFGGKVVCFCGNFWQTLPVIPRAKEGKVIQASICNSVSIWPKITVLHLTINTRLQNSTLDAVGRQEAFEFADQLLKIGDRSTIIQSPTSKNPVALWLHGHLL